MIQSEIGHQINTRDENLHNRTGEGENTFNRVMKNCLKNPFLWIFLPVYALIWAILWLSYTGREGMTNKGSYLFADHIYQGKARGFFVIGFIIDWIIQNLLPPIRGFRNRYLFTVKELISEIEIRKNRKGNIKILSCPCGLITELIDVHNHYKNQPKVLEKIFFFGMDLDPELIRRSRKVAQKYDLNISYLNRDALDPESYAETPKFDLICSSGLAEFLPGDEVKPLFKRHCEALKVDGAYITTGTRYTPWGIWLLTEFLDLHTAFRNEKELGPLLLEAGFEDVDCKLEPNYSQTICKARKEVESDGAS